jgi:hypothetical protein
MCQENFKDSKSFYLSKTEAAGFNLEFHVITLNTFGHSIFASLNFLIMKFSDFIALWYSWIKKVDNLLCEKQAT